MYTITFRPKHKLYICSLLLTIVVICYLFSLTLSSAWMANLLGDLTSGPCNKMVRWSPKPQPVVAVIGARGSGVVLARYLIEQMTGIYTGSTSHENSQYFEAEGITKKTIVVMMHSLKDLKGVQGVILIYRNMKDVVRTQFAADQGRGAFLEAPMAAYYGRTWQDYTEHHVREWTTTYRTVLDSGLPMLILGYEELLDPNQLRPQLLRISNYLHVPIRSSVLDCVIDRAHEFPGRPLPLRDGFQPFNLLAPSKQRQYEKTEWDVHMLVRLKRDRYMPKVR